MKEAGISAYLSGHDHNLQHLRIEDNNKVLNYIISGAGAATDRSQHHWDEFMENKGAKVLVQLRINLKYILVFLSKSINNQGFNQT